MSDIAETPNPADAGAHPTAPGDGPAVCIVTFGCQMNKLDSELASEALLAAGYRLTADEDAAAVILFNTCSVRDHAEQRVLSRLQQLKTAKRKRPGLLLGILGCAAQRQGEALLEAIPHLDLVCGTRQFPNLPALLEQARQGPVVATEASSLVAPGVLDAHARGLHRGVQAYVSVMRGCDNFCAYCIVPYVRGREESRPPEAVVAETRQLVERGAREITLLGQNIDAYGKDIGLRLADLLEAVHGVEGVARIRFVTSHPRDVDAELLRAVQTLPKVCNHLHMPAQSGSTPVLRAMKRGYTRAEYDAKLALVAEYAPGTLVTSDFIVGFPGETAADFDQTVDLVRRARFQNSYIFKYSPRPGTVAAQHMADDVSTAEKKRRNQELLAAQEEVNRARSAALIGTTQRILIEGRSHRDPRRLTGRTGTNLICVFDAPPDEAADAARIGTEIDLRIEDATALTLHGVPLA